MLRKRGRSLLGLSLALMMICGVSLRAEEPDEGIHMVRRGDTLWHISGTHLQDPKLWPQIWEKNKYIKNPNLIYPGDPISLPGKEGIAPMEKEAGVAPGGAPRAEELAPSPEIREEGVISAGEAIVAPGKEEKAEEGVISAGEAIVAPAKEREPSVAVSEPSRFEIAAYRPAPMVTSQVVADSGFIGGDEILRERRRIVRPLEPIDELSAGTQVIVNIGLQDHVMPGDKFSILRPVRKVYHPLRRGRLGTLIWNVGWLQIQEVMADSSKAEIAYSYIPVRVGDRLVPHQVFPFPMDSKPQPTAMQMRGYIVASREERILGERDIVYIDLGKKQGISPGDVFSISRAETMPKGSTPRGAQPTVSRMGELVVLRTEVETSSALISRSEDPIRRGDRIALEKKIP